VGARLGALAFLSPAGKAGVPELALTHGKTLPKEL
jgi:hypothetical protein